MSLVVRHRNIHVFCREEEVAGVFQHGNISRRTFRTWLEYCWRFQTSNGELANWALRCRSSVDEGVNVGELVNDAGDDGNAMMPRGSFDVVDRNGVDTIVCIRSENVYRRRTISYNMSSSASRGKTFTERIRDRDRKCLVTGETIYESGGYDGFQASHIFARAHLDIWRSKGFEALITDTGAGQSEAHIDSVQNGILLCSTEHGRFDSHKFAVNVDNGYEIFDFALRGRYHGRRLLLDHLDGESKASLRPLDELFREHLLQAVLMNVRGASETYYEDPDDDWTNPDTLRMDNKALYMTQAGRLRIETELGSRLNHLAIS